MRKLLQNSLFAAMTAWALYGVQAHLEGSTLETSQTVTLNYAQR